MACQQVTERPKGFEKNLSIVYFARAYSSLIGQFSTNADDLSKVACTIPPRLTR